MVRKEREKIEKQTKKAEEAAAKKQNAQENKRAAAAAKKKAAANAAVAAAAAAEKEESGPGQGVSDSRKKRRRISCSEIGEGDFPILQQVVSNTWPLHLTLAKKEEVTDFVQEITNGFGCKTVVVRLRRSIFKKVFEAQKGSPGYPGVTWTWVNLFWLA